LSLAQPVSDTRVETATSLILFEHGRIFKRELLPAEWKYSNKALGHADGHAISERYPYISS